MSCVVQFLQRTACNYSLHCIHADAGKRHRSNEPAISTRETLPVCTLCRIMPRSQRWCSLFQRERTISTTMNSAIREAGRLIFCWSFSSGSVVRFLLRAACGFAQHCNANAGKRHRGKKAVITSRDTLPVCTICKIG